MTKLKITFDVDNYYGNFIQAVDKKNIEALVLICNVVWRSLKDASISLYFANIRVNNFLVIIIILVYFYNKQTQNN